MVTAADLERYAKSLASSARGSVFGHGRGVGYEVGKRYAKIYWFEHGGGRSIIEFVDVFDGQIYQAVSWKKVGRRTGRSILK